MARNAHSTKPEFRDPDDAPELDETWFDEADLKKGQAVIRRGRPKSPRPKEQINIRLSAEVLSAFRETGPGWQTRIDEALKEWLRKHSPKS
jgi:uncharacterized protein (DUF4415 family)